MAFYLVSGDFEGGRIGTSPFLLTMTGEYLGGGRTGLPPHTVGEYFMHMIGNNDELNILHSQTYRAVTVEGDRTVFQIMQIVTSAVRQL